MSTFTRVYQVVESGKEVRVVVDDSGDTIKYTMPDGETHVCRQRDHDGIAECPIVNKRATAALVV